MIDFHRMLQGRPAEFGLLFSLIVNFLLLLRKMGAKRPFSMARIYGLKHIRFHDLRHSCASLMVINGVSMKQVQEWLGHSTFSTTADIYAHLDYKSKEGSAGVIANVLGESKSSI